MYSWSFIPAETAWVSCSAQTALRAKCKCHRAALQKERAFWKYLFSFVFHDFCSLLLFCCYFLWFFFPCLFLYKPTKTLFCVKFTTNVTFQWETPCICLTQFFLLPVFSVPLHSQHWVFVGLNIKGLRKAGASRFEFMRLPDMECHMCFFLPSPLPSSSVMLWSL